MLASADFKLSISRALTDQLRTALHQLEPAPLMADQLEKIEPRQGVYQLYLDDDLVYVGSASASLRDRLTEHMWKVAGRQNITADVVRFTCLYVDEDLTVLAPEERLMRVFQEEGSCAWNGMGFGLHDPGRKRDGTRLKDNHFDLAYPIRLDWVCEGIAAGAYTVLELLADLKRELPYNFRYENDTVARSEYAFVSVEIPDDNMTALALFELIATALPAYQITALPGYVIMYKESNAYPQGRGIRSEDRVDPSGP